MDVIISDQELADIRPVGKKNPDEHKPSKCTTCGVELQFLGYATKPGKDGRAAKWPTYAKCSNPDCKTGQKTLKALQQDRQGGAQAKVIKQAKSTPGWEKELKERRNKPISQILAEQAEKPAEAVDASEAPAAKRGLPTGGVSIDRSVYTVYQLDEKHPLRDLEAICRSYQPGAVKMNDADLTVLVANSKIRDVPRMEYREDFVHVLVCSGYRPGVEGTAGMMDVFPIARAEGLTPLYRYVAADKSKKLVQK